MPRRINQRHHDFMIKYMINQLIHAGYGNICADIPGYKRPLAIPYRSNSHMPDLTAEKDAEKILVEVETDDSIYEDHTETQWIALDKYIRSNDAKLIFVAPGISRSKLTIRANELGIKDFMFIGF